jgi:hypothetical protein
MPTKVFDAFTRLDASDVNAYLANKSISNAIINGAFDIWQRGTSFALTGAYNYTADRFTATSASGSGATLSRQASGLTGFNYAARLQRNSGSTVTGSIDLLTTLETQNSIPLAGQTIALSAYVRKGTNFSATTSLLRVRIITGTGTDQPVQSFTGFAVQRDATQEIKTEWDRYTFTVTLPTTTTEIGIIFGYTPTGTAGANDWLEITGIQLEPGTVANDFRRNANSLPGELAACQRYYQTFGSGAFGSVRTSTASELGGAFRVSMRATPSITVIGSGEYLNVGISNQTVTFTLNSTIHRANGGQLNVSHGSVGGATPNLSLSIDDVFGLSAEL